MAGDSLVSLPLFVVGGVLAGGAAGIPSSSAVTAAGHAAEAGNRGEAIPGIFLSAYTGLALPVIVLGIAIIAAIDGDGRPGGYSQPSGYSQPMPSPSRSRCLP